MPAMCRTTVCECVCESAGGTAVAVGCCHAMLAWLTHGEATTSKTASARTLVSCMGQLRSAHVEVRLPSRWRWWAAHLRKERGRGSSSHPSAARSPVRASVLREDRFRRRELEKGGGAGDCVTMPLRLRNRAHHDGVEISRPQSVPLGRRPVAPVRARTHLLSGR